MLKAEEFPIELAFENFDDYWSTLPKDEVDDMSEPEIDRIKATLPKLVPPGPNGEIRYAADVNVIRGRVPTR